MANDSMNGTIQLREMQVSDIEDFFLHQQDEDANQMAAFTSKDQGNKELFKKKWIGILDNDAIVKRTIVSQNRIVGNVMMYVDPELNQPEITYWIGKADWGKGIATKAVKQFLKLLPDRPIYARAVADNKGSIRVLEKCGFEVVGREKGYANARGMEVEEVVMAINVNSKN